MDTKTDELDGKMAVLWRGVKGRCPNCGQGKLFRVYISQNKACSACGEDLSELRADDAPPWLTIFITGHIVVPMIVEFVKYDVFEEWIETSIILAVAFLCVFLILPRAKGLFLAGLWRQSKL